MSYYCFVEGESAGSGYKAAQECYARLPILYKFRLSLFIIYRERMNVRVIGCRITERQDHQCEIESVIPPPPQFIPV